MHTEFWLKNLKGRDHSEELSVDVNIRMDFKERGVGKVWIGCIWLRDRDQWRAIVNTAVNLWVP
jgi:hypothetical protein